MKFQGKINGVHWVSDIWTTFVPAKIDYTVHTAYGVIGFSVKSGIMSILGWYRFPSTNNYWTVSKIGYSANGKH